MKPNSLLTIAIPTYNNYQQIAQCLWSLLTYTEFPYRVVVVNNGSPRDADGRPFEDHLRSIVSYPDLVVHQSEQNLGWQGAINLAFEQYCETPYFCMANDDLVFLPYHRDFWRNLVKWFNDPEVGSVGPSTNYVMGSQSIFQCIPQTSFETTLLVGFLMVTRSEVFSQVGGLDDGLRGGDDLDYSILVRKNGYRLICDRTAYVHHIGSQTGPRVERSGFWNSQEHVEATNNAIIRKHGVREWFDCLQSRVLRYEAGSQKGDVEGDLIRSWCDKLDKGLDVGCGSNKTIAAAVGVDLLAEGECGTAGGTKGAASVATVASDATHLPFDDDSQDYVIARHVLEHIVDPIVALNEWKRVLKHGGVLVVACPDEDRCNSILLDHTHVHAFNPNSLMRMARLVGFQVNIDDVALVHPGFSFVMKCVKPTGRFEGYVHKESAYIEDRAHA